MPYLRESGTVVRLQVAREIVVVYMWIQLHDRRSEGR